MDDRFRFSEHDDFDEKAMDPQQEPFPQAKQFHTGGTDILNSLYSLTGFKAIDPQKVRTTWGKPSRPKSAEACEDAEGSDGKQE